jgi:hypothetical protein
MKLYLSRRASGSYQVTALQPIRTTMLGCATEDVYPRPGDPVTLGGLCPFSIHKLFGRELAPLECPRARAHGGAEQGTALIQGISACQRM